MTCKFYLECFGDVLKENMKILTKIHLCCLWVKYWLSTSLFFWMTFILFDLKLSDQNAASMLESIYIYVCVCVCLCTRVCISIDIYILEHLYSTDVLTNILSKYNRHYFWLNVLVLSISYLFKDFSQLKCYLSSSFQTDWCLFNL